MDVEREKKRGGQGNYCPKCLGRRTALPFLVIATISAACANLGTGAGVTRSEAWVDPAGSGMSPPGVLAGISVTGGGGRVQRCALFLGSVPGRYLTMSKLTSSPMSTLSLEPLAMKCK